MALHVMDEANHCLGCKVPRCQQGCPIHTNIPEVIRLLKANRLDEAGRMLFENNPLTTVCSLVCNHENQCEGHCVRGIKGAPVHFSVIENYISSTYASQMTQGPAPSNGKKAAIIGSRELQKPGQVIPDKGKTTVIYGKPIEVEKKPLDQITHDDLRSLTDRVTMEIQKMSGQEYVNEYAQKVKEQLKAAKEAEKQLKQD